MTNGMAFAQFPAADSEDGYHLIDIFTIEAISQSSEPTVAAIFTRGTDRFYQIAVPEEVFQQIGEKDAAGWALNLVSRVSRVASGVGPDLIAPEWDIDANQPVIPSGP